MTVQPIQGDAAYHEGFFDAIDGEPLHVDATPLYRAGWLAWWRVHEIINQDGFIDTPAVNALPRDPFLVYEREGR